MIQVSHTPPYRSKVDNEKVTPLLVDPHIYHSNHELSEFSKLRYDRLMNFDINPSITQAEKRVEMLTKKMKSFHRHTSSIDHACITNDKKR